MIAMAHQITSLTIFTQSFIQAQMTAVKNHQSSASLAFVRGIPFLIIGIPKQNLSISTEKCF